jgi:prephenate dehydrogenase
MRTHWRRLSVVGVGLIGGSIARAARARRLCDTVVGVGRSRASLEPALAAGAIDVATDHLADGVRDADLVVLCAPVGALPGLVRAAWPHLGPETLFTDTGSVKRGVVAAADGCSARPGVTFVGSHPMAGSERSGFGASDPELFAGRLALVTETATTDPDAVAEVTAFWESLGSHVRTVSVDAHDRGVAVISHLVHLAAYGLVAAADGDALSLAARGFVDTTRLAASAEALWTDIFRENRPALLEAIDGYRRVLDCWEGWIRAGRWEALEAALGRAREIREKFA